MQQRLGKVTDFCIHTTVKTVHQGIRVDNQSDETFTQERCNPNSLEIKVSFCGMIVQQFDQNVKETTIRGTEHCKIINSFPVMTTVIATLKHCVQRLGKKHISTFTLCFSYEDTWHLKL